MLVICTVIHTCALSAQGEIILPEDNYITRIICYYGKYTTFSFQVPLEARIGIKSYW